MPDDAATAALQALVASYRPRPCGVCKNEDGTPQMVAPTLGETDGGYGQKIPAAVWSCGSSPNIEPHWKRAVPLKRIG